MARQARLVMAGHGSDRFGSARQAWQGMDRFGTVWPIKVRQARLGEARFDPVGSGQV